MPNNRIVPSTSFLRSLNSSNTSRSTGKVKSIAQLKKNQKKAKAACALNNNNVPKQRTPKRSPAQMRANLKAAEAVAKKRNEAHKVVQAILQNIINGVNRIQINEKPPACTYKRPSMRRRR